jgi:hypothetical protein
MSQLRSKRLGAVMLVALPMSQLGHAMAYLLRYGSDAWQQESSGTHAYFPDLLITSGLLGGAGVLSGMFAAAAVRLLLGRCRGLREGDRWPFLPMAALLLLTQLLFFMTQEAAEATLSGESALPALPGLVYGLAAQAPIAFLAALALYALSSNLDAVLREWRRPAVPLDLPPKSAGSLACCPAPTNSRLGQSAPAVFGKRGPPSPLLVNIR